jgi:O-antigen ligase
MVENIQALERFKGLRKNGYFSYCCAVLSVIIIPLYNKLFPPVLILWCLAWIFENHDKRPVFIKIDPYLKILFILSISLFTWQLVGVIYSNDSKNGLEFVGMRLPLLLLPFLLLSPGCKMHKNISQLLRIFALCVFSFIIICFANALIKSLTIVDGIMMFKPYQASRYWDNYFFSSGGLTLNVHPSYLALFALFSVLISFDSIFNKSLKRCYRIVWQIINLFLIGSLYFISSRSGLLALILIIPIYLFGKLNKAIRLFVSLLSILLILVIFFSVLSKNFRINNYIQKASKSSPSEIFMLDERGNIWKSTIRVINNNFLLGVGTGDGKAELFKEYNKGNYEIKIDNRYNAHNQYLEFFLENGIVGLIIFLSMLVWMFIISVKRKNILYTLFVLTFVFFFFFESMLNRLAGISFFSLFSFLLLHVKPKAQIPE